MQYPISASITLVQLDAEDEVHAWVSYGETASRGGSVHVELKLGTLSDAVDRLMWMQMAAASVCDAL